MSRRTVALLGTILGLAIGAGPASASSENHTTPGIPGTKDCSGQSTAFVAQIGAEAGTHGVAGVASAVGFTVQEVHKLVGEFCVS